MPLSSVLLKSMLASTASAVSLTAGMNLPTSTSTSDKVSASTISPMVAGIRIKRALMYASKAARVTRPPRFGTPSARDRRTRPRPINLA